MKLYVGEIMGSCAVGGGSDITGMLTGDRSLAAL